MRRSARTRPAAHRVAWAILASLPVATVGLFAAGAFNGPGVPIPQANLGSLVAAPTGGCLVEFTATLRTEGGGGEDAFEVQVFDDGRRIEVLALSAAADGLIHDVSGEFRLAGPPGDETPGIGLYLVDDGQILDLIDPLGVPCTILEVPVLGRGGLVALFGLLACVALGAISRLRRA